MRFLFGVFRLGFVFFPVMFLALTSFFTTDFAVLRDFTFKSLLSRPSKDGLLYVI